MHDDVSKFQSARAKLAAERQMVAEADAMPAATEQPAAEAAPEQPKAKKAKK